MISSENIYFCLWHAIRIEVDHFNATGNWIDAKLNFRVFWHLVCFLFTLIPRVYLFEVLTKISNCVLQSPLLHGQPKSFLSSQRLSNQSSAQILCFSVSFLFSKSSNGTAAPRLNSPLWASLLSEILALNVLSFFVYLWCLQTHIFYLSSSPVLS